jgi:hypothetical protein
VTDAGEGGYVLEAGAARNIDVTQFLHVLNLFATIGAVAVWSVLWREAESRDELFVSTRWTIVLKAGDSGGDFRSGIQCAIGTVPDLLAQSFFHATGACRVSRKSPVARLFLLRARVRLFGKHPLV